VNVSVKIVYLKRSNGAVKTAYLKRLAEWSCENRLSKVTEYENRLSKATE